MKEFVILSTKELNDIAEQHVKEDYSPDCAILRSEEYPELNGIYYYANIKSDNVLEQHLGPGGFFISKRTGTVFVLGSGQVFHEGIDYWIKIYAAYDREGLKLGMYKLLVTAVAKLSRMSKLIAGKGDALYAVLEQEGGTVWTKWVEYDVPTAMMRLERLPSRFLLSTAGLYMVITELRKKNIATCSFEYIGDRPKYDWRPEKYESVALGPQWD